MILLLINFADFLLVILKKYTYCQQGDTYKRRTKLFKIVVFIFFVF
jgi:hypothetical protein